jgi:hypothetical protein
MSGFVNYNKRGVDLPPGCKDLHDLLVSKSLRKKPLLLMPEKRAKALESHEENTWGTINEIRQRVAQVFASRAQLVGLTASPPTDDFSFGVYRIEGQDPVAYIMFGDDKDREQTVRGFYVAYRLHLPAESWKPGNASYDLPFNWSYPISPMPCNHLLLSAIAMNFFTEACGMDKTSKILFRLFEASSAA